MGRNNKSNTQKPNATGKNQQSQGSGLDYPRRDEPNTENRSVESESKPESKPEPVQPVEDKKPEEVGSEQCKSLNRQLMVPMIRTAGYASRRIDMPLSANVAQTLRDILDGLLQMDAKLKSGKPVKSQPNAIQWILEQLEQKKVKN